MELPNDMTFSNFRVIEFDVISKVEWFPFKPEVTGMCAIHKSIFILVDI